MHSETIVALSSGQLPSGVAVVRISGPASRECLQRLTGSVPAERRASYRRIRNGEGETIDRGIALFFPGPGSVTGEDLAEFHLHGGRAVVSACLEALAAIEGVRFAQAGEFTRRAFDNGRIDLTEAEGLADLIAAETQSQRRLAVAQSGGSLRSLYEGWMKRLTHARAMIEASFDFADEGDVGEDAAASVAGDVAALAGEMRRHLAQARRGEILRDGYRVAIVGAPNAGKSSLLNALAERDVAIVTDVPGTTRDVIEVRLDLGGLPVLVSDTAGLRETGDVVEAIGVERAQAAIAASDLVLLLVDPDDGTDIPAAIGPLTHVKHSGAHLASADKNGSAENSSRASNLLVLRSKADLHGSPIAETGHSIESSYDLAISSKTGTGMAELMERIADLASAAAGDPAEAIPVRSRHREIVADALRLLEDLLGNRGQPPEVAAETLRRAADRLGGLTGRVGVEDLLDIIFSQFCIGK